MNKSFLSVISIRDALYHSQIQQYRDNAFSRHKLVMSLFPQHLGENPRGNNNILFRLETINTDGKYQQRILIRSAIAPANLSGVISIEEPSVEGLLPGDLVAIRVTASPIKRKGSKERALSDIDEQEAWIKDKLQDAIAIDDVVNLDVSDISRTNKKGSFVRLAQYDAIGTIVNAEELGRLLIRGVGRNKSYGAGLLTIRKL